MKRILVVVALAVLAAPAFAQSVATDCPCSVRYEVPAKDAGALMVPIKFKEPFPLVPVCTVNMENRAAGSLRFEAATTTSALVRNMQSGGAPFITGEVVRLTCTLSNRRR